MYQIWTFELDGPCFYESVDIVLNIYSTGIINIITDSRLDNVIKSNMY